jgi:hypothetical protein
VVSCPEQLDADAMVKRTVKLTWIVVKEVKEAFIESFNLFVQDKAIPEKRTEETEISYR